MNVNFGNVSSDYAKYRDQLPPVFFEQLKDKGIQFEGLKVVDLGVGTGIFSRALEKQGANVIGIEPLRSLIDEAIALDVINKQQIRYIEATAEEFSLAETFPMFTVVRAWHWFERLKVIMNIKKHLTPNGHVVIANSIFVPDSVVAQLTFEVLRDNNIELKPVVSNAEVKERRNGFPVNWFNEWEHSSLQILEEWQHDYMLQFTHEDWCGKIRSVSWLTNVDEGIRQKITRELIEKLSTFEEVLNVPHRYYVVVLKNLSS
jgi:SAM-dependent methyltransferase